MEGILWAKQFIGLFYRLKKWLSRKGKTHHCRIEPQRLQNGTGSTSNGGLQIDVETLFVERISLQVNINIKQIK